MTNNNQNNDRLDQIEQAIAETQRLTQSNARAIEALANDCAQNRQEIKRLYELMYDLNQQQSQLCNTIAELNERQGELNNHQGELSLCQKEIVEIFRQLSRQEKDQ
jgi:division protein CdvB (Snf7/Vps24/ESCRT-III family)